MSTSISAKEIWLTYFNNTLYEKGIITEKEKNKMNSLISNYRHGGRMQKQKFIMQS